MGVARVCISKRQTHRPVIKHVRAFFMSFALYRPDVRMTGFAVVDESVYPSTLLFAFKYTDITKNEKVKCSHKIGKSTQYPSDHK